jgi:general L-amino acid transport system permease protein
MTATTDLPTTRPPIWRDLRIIRIVVQVVAVAVAVALVILLYQNLTRNMRAAGISTTFRFLNQPLGVNIAGSPLPSNAPIWRGLVIGIKNTFALVLVGIPILTTLGVLIGIGKLSTNWLVAKICAIYVEIFRNLPPLLILFFVYNAVILRLPLLDESWNPLGLIIVNRRFIAVPSFQAQATVGMFVIVMAIALAVAVGIWIWRTRRWEQTGEPHRRVLWSLGWLIAVGLGAYAALGGPIRVSIPNLEGLILTGGISGLAPYFAVLIALSLYTASHVAEITRGSIQAVAKGQTEASNSLALSTFQRLRYVVLPQAMRVGLPPTISQYLNFTKNTSLAIAVGYAEITRLTFQAVGNGHPAPQLVALLMLSYLIFSLTISLLVNILNRRLAYVTR